MNQTKVIPQPAHSQNLFERFKKWIRRLLQQERHPDTPRKSNTDPLTSNGRSAFASEQEGRRSTTETGRSHPQHQQDIHNTQPPYLAAIPTLPPITSFATQFQGAHNFSISGNPTFTNIGTNNGVNNVNTFNNHGRVHVDNRGQQSYNLRVGTQYGNTNIGDNQQNGGSTYNFRGNS